MVEFIKALRKAKKGYKGELCWRVSEERHAREWVTDGGSTFAVDKDGNICGICRNKEDTITGKELVKMAIKCGGIKMQAFGRDLFEFYTRLGFEPVTWCLFRERDAPKGWKKKYGAEPMIFYAYTKKKREYKSMDDFIAQTWPEKNSKEAYQLRDSYIALSKKYL